MVVAGDAEEWCAAIPFSWVCDDDEDADVWGLASAGGAAAVADGNAVRSSAAVSAACGCCCCCCCPLLAPPARASSVKAIGGGCIVPSNASSRTRPLAMPSIAASMSAAMRGLTRLSKRYSGCARTKARCHVAPVWISPVARPATKRM